MSGKKKEEIVTFKVDQGLWHALRSIPNRSEFIRRAIQAAMDHVCPLCQGAGTLTPDQSQHWRRFAENHALEECDECHAFHLVCEVEHGSLGDDSQSQPLEASEE